MKPHNNKLTPLRCLSFNFLMVLLLAGCESDRQSGEPQASQSFTIAVIPDTQNYLDYRHQSANGFAIDASELFIQQMQWIADHAQGNKVYQVLADYQDRGRVGLDTGQAPSLHTGKPVGIGDGWFRLMHFDMSAEVLRIQVRTYSSHYQALSGELDNYVDWYKGHEQPAMTAAEFLAADEFELDLGDFRQRFGAPQ